MRKLVPFCAAMSAAFIFGGNAAMASSTINLTGNTTTAQTLTSNTESFTLSAGGTLTVAGTSVLPATTTSPSTVALTINTNNASGTTTATILNLGTIEQTGNQFAIQEGGGTNITLTNGSTTNSAATIKGDGNDAIHLSKSSDNATINNYGQIVSVTGGQGIDTSGISSASGSLTINNFSTGLIEGQANDGLQTAINAKVYNDGSIIGLGSGSDGINAGTNSGAVIVNSLAFSGDTVTTGTITGAHHGITGGTGVDTALSSYDKPYTMSVTNNVGGVITGKDGSGINVDGVDATELVTVVNSGSITGNGVTGDGDGVDVDGLVNITNNAKATIISTNANGDGSEGVTVGGGTIVNSGQIEGDTTGTSTYARGITLAGIDHTETSGVETDIPMQSVYGTTTVTNNSGGVIRGQTESGIAVLGTSATGFTVTINNNAGGLIEGKNTSVSEDTVIATGANVGKLNGGSLNQAAIELDDTKNSYVVNESGTITQDTTATGTAIAMHSAVSNTLNITGGTAVITGNISGDTAADSTLNISPGAGNSFSYGYKVSNFTTNINYDGTLATTGTVTFSGASDNVGTTTVKGGTFNVTNTTGSATGTGKVVVNGAATLGGTGIIAPGAGNGVTLAKNSTLVSGGAQSGTTAGSGLTLDNTVAQGVILDASLGNATLSFSLGANHSATTMTVLGITAKELSFASTDTFALTDLNNDPLTAFSINTPFILIQAGTIPGLALDNAFYTGLTTTGGVDANGNALNGYVTSPISIMLNGVNQTGKLQLYLNNGALEVIPEPGTWALLVGGMGVLLFVQFRRRQKSN